MSSEITLIQVPTLLLDGEGHASHSVLASYGRTCAVVFCLSPFFFHPIKIPPQSLLGKAFNYTLGQWPRLIKYLDNGLVGMDNNLIENAIRPFVIGRKNWLFSVSPEGAKASALFYSIIETAKANGIEPFKYLQYLIEKFPCAKTSEDVFNLLPMSISKKDIDK